MKLRVSNITVRLNSTEILKEVSLEIHRGEFVSLLGPNGSGKSTILRTIYGILKPTGGAVYLNGKELNGAGFEEVAKLIGYLPQEQSEANLKVLDVVLLGRTPYIRINPGKDDYALAMKALELVGMENFAHRRFSELSGGEKQKVMLARIFCQNTDFMLLDEPTAHLDVKSQLEILEIVKKMVKAGKSTLISLHDINLAAMFSDRILMIRNGKIIYAGTPEEVIRPDRIEEVFGIRAEVIRHNQRILVIPEVVR
ncbi:ATP-binding cassette domain-containing protein [Geoglobus acetivorans]|uniref:ABC transporter ATP-binding protein n=1 Tax=Geoglobus acetivorans TaxID=565033 RepID=A0ABZ3H3E6_GEOAI|nr:ABC transporter ATP-binding protein [Geoglobus acetivorans]